MYRWIWVWMMLGAWNSAAQETQPPSLYYKTDLTLSWLNGGERWSIINKNRSLGLSRAGIELSWTQHRQARLFLAFRPDAILTGRQDPEGRVFEFERRAGSVYQSTPQVEFLDLYHMQFDFSEAFSFGVGVYSDFTARLEPYSSPLEFGLLPQLPSKIAALRITGAKHTYPLALTNAPAGTEKNFDFSLYAFNGSKDRVETLGYSDRSFDYGPESQQTRKGVAAAVTKYVHPKWAAYGLGGTFDCKEKEDRIRSSLFGEASLQYRTHFYYPLLTSLDARWVQDKWLSDFDIPSVIQTSLSWKAQLDQDAFTSILLGLHWGKSERLHKKTTFLYNKDLYEGHQLEAGLRRQLRGFLFGNLMVSYEKRMKRDDEGWQDGFSTKDSSYTRPSVYRIAVELLCLLGSS